MNNKNLVTDVIWDDELVAVCAIDHALSKKKSINALDLLDYPYIAREEGSGTREVIENYLLTQGLECGQLDVIMEFGSPESIKNAVAAGLGISVLSIVTLEKELALNTLCAIPLKNPVRRPFTIVHQRQQFRLRAMEEFLGFAREHCTVKQKLLLRN